MQVKSKIKQVYKELNGEYILVLQIPPSLLATIDELKDKDIGLTLEKYTNPKSMRAHRYMWSLIGQLAKKLRTDQLTIYRRILTEYSPLSFFCSHENANRQDNTRKTMFLKTVRITALVNSI